VAANKYRVGHTINMAAKETNEAASRKVSMYGRH
jgi:hypothetical protein